MGHCRLLGIFLALSASAALGQTSPPPNPCQGPDFEAFDFWEGVWEVHTSDGTAQGLNRIEKLHGGCMLLESWTSVRGGTGTSLNYFDVAASQWVQVWSGVGGSQIDIRGGLVGESMVLTGTLTTAANKATVPFRGTWTPLPDGRVRQFFEQSTDDGKTWAPWFEGFYRRMEAATDEE